MAHARNRAGHHAIPTALARPRVNDQTMVGFTATRVISIAGLVPDAGKPWGLSPREAMEWCARMGARGVVLDGARDGIRARQLDSSARRSVVSLLRRLDLRFRGIDLWIPPNDFWSPSSSNRAIDAACAALELCADLHRLCGERSIAPAVNLTLPPVEGDATATASTSAARAAIAAAAARVGACIADFGQGGTTMVAEADAPMGAGLDPVTLLSGGHDPAHALASLKAPLRGVRERTPSVLSRATRSASVRFDALAYRALLATRGVVTDAPDDPSPGAHGPPLVLDVRSEERPEDSLRALWSPFGSASRDAGVR